MNVFLLFTYHPGSWWSVNEFVLYLTLNYIRTLWHSIPAYWYAAKNFFFFSSYVRVTSKRPVSHITRVLFKGRERKKTVWIRVILIALFPTNSLMFKGSKDSTHLVVWLDVYSSLFHTAYTDSVSRHPCSICMCNKGLHWLPFHQSDSAYHPGWCRRSARE